MSQNNIQKIVYELISDDQEFTKRYNNHIIYIYNNATRKQQLDIDMIFADLTGYSLISIINRSKKGVSI